mgnify:CR=1 FL=1
MADDGWQPYQGAPTFGRRCGTQRRRRPCHRHQPGRRDQQNSPASKIHLIVDACGNPLEVIITAGNVNDVSIAPELIAAVDLAETEVVSADKGYDSDKLRAQIEEEGSKANIPYKRDREEKNKDMDWYLYKIRHLVENAFARLKHYRAIATRYDKLKRNYLSTVLLGCIMVWLPL